MEQRKLIKKNNKYEKIFINSVAVLCNPFTSYRFCNLIDWNPWCDMGANHNGLGSGLF
jgi:hypothetical protein